jgi:hypothetical protein
MKINNPLHTKFKQDIIILNSKTEFDVWWNYEKSIRPDIENMDSNEWMLKPNIEKFPNIIIKKYKDNGKYHRFEVDRDYYVWKSQNIIYKLNIKQQQEILKYLQQNYE